MKTETLIIIGAAVLIFGGPVLKALANGVPMASGEITSLPDRAVLDPAGGPTRVQDPLAVPRPTVQPIEAFSVQSIGGDIVSNDFVPYGPDVSVISVEEVGKEEGKGFFDSPLFLLNPIGATINGILNIF